MYISCTNFSYKDIPKAKALLLQLVEFGPSLQYYTKKYIFPIPLRVLSIRCVHATDSATSTLTCDVTDVIFDRVVRLGEIRTTLRFLNRKYGKRFPLQ